MLKRCVLFFFLLSVVSPVFSATPTNSGSGSVPEMKFESWRVGRSPTGTNINSDEQKSFITSTSTSTYLEASVVYKGGTQPRNSGISPIDPSTVKWKLDEGLNKGWALAELPGTSWSGLHPSKLSGTTSFNVVAKFSFPPFNDRTYYTISGSCGGNDARRSRSSKHRDGEAMKITVKFSAKTYSGASVYLTLPLLQDEKDQIRQEHVDYNRVIPSRDSLIDSDGDYNNFGHVYYDFGHYDYMIDKGLKGYQQKWVKSINDRERKDKAALTLSDFTLNSAYRNPHHNFEHAGSNRSRISAHMYGYALDIQGRDVDDKEGEDQKKMDDAADAAGARYTDIYSSGHVHGDWAPSNWGSSKYIGSAPNDFDLDPQSTDTASFVETPNNPAPNAPNAPPAPSSSSTPPSSSSSSLQACGHRYDPNSSSAHSHRSVNFPCGNHSYYACAPATTSEIARHSSGPLPCGAHTGYPCDLVLKHLRMRPCPPDANGNSCLIGSYYGCLPHSHSYPAMKTCGAGHSYRADHPNVKYLDTLHRTRTCRREACGRSWQPCISGWAAANCPASSTGRPCWGTDD